MNRLGSEKSPYLLQHAHNPVDWFPWGDEAFEKAKTDDKPILLSIGYSTCHWCHVMEHESFEDQGIAELMNENFVCIKLDREERPEIDKLYMTAVQTMTGQGGWPLNVFLTPDGKPFFGGTYFPPEPRYGQPAWPALLARVAELWKERRLDIGKDAGRMASALSAHATGSLRKGELSLGLADRAFEALRGAFDPENKGIGGAPKFPMPVNLDFLLHHHARTGDARARSMLVETLEAMGAGGIFDQLGGGFHRYSVDAEWRVPHFEKMLYDNAQLVRLYSRAFALTGDARFRRVADKTFDYLLRDMFHPGGGFYSAEDADSVPPELMGGDRAEKKEGAFYLWSEAEIRKALGDEAECFLKLYGVEPDGNAPADPHGDFEGKNILYRPGGLQEEEPEDAIARLRALRAKRPHPHLDDKILVSWNGLMISALAAGHEALGREDLLKAAVETARFIRKELYEGGALFHRWRDGQKAVPALADDHAFLAQGLLDLFEASGEPEWLEWSIELCETLLKRFAAPEGGFYMTAEGHDARLLARVLEDSDNVEPSASSVAALALQRLFLITGRDEFRAAAQKTLEGFAGTMRERALASIGMTRSLGFFLRPAKKVVVAGTRANPLLGVLRSHFQADRVFVRITQKTRAHLIRLAPFLKSIDPTVNAVYLCEGTSCGLPITDPKKLEGALAR